MKCQACHRTVTRKSKFCPNCGERIVPRTGTKQATKAPKPPLGYAVGLVALGLMLGYIVFKDSGTQRASVQTASGFQSSSLPAAIADIAREFNCVCGECSHSLDECDCEHDNGAVEVKGFIAQKLQEAHHKPHIVEMVQDRYAGRKNQTVPALDPVTLPVSGSK